MKHNSILFLSLVISSIVFFGCTSAPGEDTHSEDIIIADDTAKMETDSFSLLLSDYENEDRVIWQKPGMVIDLLGNLENKTVADLGAGSGYFSFRLLPSAGKVLALDIDERAIAYMDSIKSGLPADLASKLELRLVGTSDAGMKQNEVDAVLMVNTYMYLANRVKYLSDLKKMIKPGGQLIIIDFKKKSMPIGPQIGDKVDLSTVEAELRDAGFTIFNSNDTALDYQYIIKATR